MDVDLPQHGSSPTVWQPAPPTPRLGHADVHVWRLRIDRLDFDHCSALLSADEQLRAQRLVFPDTRRAFVVARGSLRCLLARYLNESPQHLQFLYGRHGKPSLAAHDGQGALSFNLSHSHHFALVAVARDREVGTDVELIRNEVASDDLAQRFFAANETKHWRDLPDAARHRAFFQHWARREAISKATGMGLTDSMNESGPEHTAWRIEDVSPDKGFVGAVAAHGNDWEMTCYDIPSTFSR